MISVLSRFFKASAVRAKKDHLVSGPVAARASVAAPAKSKGLPVQGELVILGVLLNFVAQADGHFLAEEESAVKDILIRRGVKKEEVGLVLAAAREAADQRMDIQGFTREINEKNYGERLKVVELLFEVSLADKTLSLVELESVRKVARLLWIDHGDFTDAKIRVKKKSGGTSAIQRHFKKQ